jgi:hypothetical protein
MCLLSLIMHHVIRTKKCGISIDYYRLLSITADGNYGNASI